MSKTPVMDLGRCTGCEACLELCPDVFRRNETGFIEVAMLDNYPHECIDEAINCCPADCITWEES